MTNGAYVEFVEAGGYDDPQWWTDEGWAWRAGGRARAPAVLDPRRRRVDPAPVRPRRAAPRARAGAARLLVRGRRVRPLARRAPPHRGRVGEGRAGRDRAGGSSGTAGGSGPTRSAPTPSGASAAGVLDLLGGVWEWTASDFAAYPGFRSFPYREYSEVFFGAGVAATRCCAVGRGPRTRSRAASRSATGTSRSGARSSPASAARPTPDAPPDVPPPRVPRPSGRAPHAALRRAARARATRRARRSSRRAGPDNPDGWGVAWDASRSSWYRSATPMWEDTGFADVGRASTLVLAAARSASPGSALRRARTPRRSSAGAWVFSLNGFVVRLPRRVRRRAPRADRRPARRERHRGRHRQRGAVRAGRCDRLDDGRVARRGARRRHPDRAEPRAPAR